MPTSDFLAVTAKEQVIKNYEQDAPVSALVSNSQQLNNKIQNNVSAAVSNNRMPQSIQDELTNNRYSPYHEFQHDDEHELEEPVGKREKPNLYIETHNLEFSPVSGASSSNSSDCVTASGSNSGSQASRRKRVKTPSIQEIVEAQHNNFQIPSLLHDALLDKKLNFLNLSGRQLKNSHMKEICETLTQDEAFKDVYIEELNLSNNKFDDECAPYLAQLIKKNLNIKSLLLDGNFIRDTGAEDILDALYDNKTITHISLNLISDDIMDDIESLLNSNRHKSKKKEEIKAIIVPYDELEDDVLDD